MNPYIKIARPDHWFKNIFMAPGVALGLFLGHTDVTTALLWNITWAVIATCLAASANYTINEWLDAEFDQFHPIKKARPSVSGKVHPLGVYIQWALLCAVSLAIGYTINLSFLVCLLVLLIMGVLYNVKPFRTKDRMHLDTLSESVNNPLRFMLGWLAVTVSHLPPSSILLAYWMAGAYLMTVKRYSEYRYINDPDKAALYRRSFRYYTENNLLLAAFFYALTAAFFLGVFLIKYRIEYLLAMPLLAFVFVWYLRVGMGEDSAAQRPEKLYKEKTLMALLLMTVVLFMVLTFVDIPVLNILLESHVLS